MPSLRDPVRALRAWLPTVRLLPAVATFTLAAAATVATVGVSCSNKEGGGEGGAAGEGEGGQSGQGAQGQGGEGEGGEGQAGGDGAGGGGASAGNGDAGSAGTGGTRDAMPDTSMARACKGMPNSGSGDEVQVMRTDMSVTKRLDTPDDVTRLARDPVSGKLFLMVEDGTISRIDVQGDTWTRSVVHTPASIGLATGDRAYGMGFGSDGTLYVVSHLPKEKSASSSVATVWQGKLANDGARSWRKLAQTAPYGRSNTIFDHEWSGVAVSADGKHVFINAGSRTDHGEQHGGARESALTAKIFRLPTDAAQTIALGDDLADLKAKGYVFAEGVRNAYDPAFAPNGDLLAGDNGPDADYHEELIHIEQGKHYGFPWRIGNEDNQMQFPSYDPTADKRLDPAYEAIKLRYWYKDSTFPAKPAGVAFVEPIMNVGPAANQYRDPTTGDVKRGNIGTFSDHGSPVGLTFDLAKDDLCGPFHGAAFILRHGKAAGDFEDGRDLLLLELTKQNGVYKQVKVTQLARFFQGPVDAVLVGDKMFVLDRGSSGRGGKLWEIGMPNGR